MPADEARRRDLGIFRGVLIALPVCLAPWLLLLALLISRAT